MLDHMCAQSLSPVRLFATPRSTVRQAPLPTGFPSKNTGMGCHFLLQEGNDLLPEIKPTSPTSPALAGRFFTTEPSGKSQWITVMGPKSRNECPYKREAEGDLRHKRLCDNRGKDWSEHPSAKDAKNAKEHQSPPEARRLTERKLSQGILKEPTLQHIDFRLLASRAGRGSTAITVSSPGGGTWLHQP